jgi:hypothetical protein
LTGGRFAPELSLTIAGTEVKNDIASLSCDFSVTDQVQALEVELGNLADKYAALKPFDEIVLKVNGTQRLYARADSCNPDYSKAGAKVFRVKGRQIGGSALQDIVASLQFVDEHPDDIVDGIMASYNASKGTSDPTITVASNLAPTDITMNFRWQRKNYWKMLQELQEALGGPVADGGADEFFDFWLDPATTGDFYFENAGHRDSTVVILDNTEATKAKRVVDATAVKNDIWVWGNSQAGRVPLEMQEGYNIGDVTDPWTEGNAADFTATGSPTTGVTIQDQTDTGLGLPYVKVGHQSLHMKGFRNMITEERATMHLVFPKDGDGVVWPAQDPGGHFNAYNEIALSESMGEFVGCHFWFKSNTNCVILIQVTDGAGVVAYSPGYGYQVGWWPPKDAGDWQEILFPFGPSAKYSVVADTRYPPVPIFDWSNVVEIAWVCKASSFQGYPNPNADYWFDGLYFIKPLVVNAYSTSDGVRKSAHVAKDEIVNYTSAKLIANALLEQQKMAQIYWDFDEIGRDDIPSGFRFTLGSTELLMREQRWQFSKESGWTLTGKAWEKT